MKYSPGIGDIIKETLDRKIIIVKIRKGCNACWRLQQLLNGQTPEKVRISIEHWSEELYQSSQDWFKQLDGSLTPFKIFSPFFTKEKARKLLLWACDEFEKIHYGNTARVD